VAYLTRRGQDYGIHTSSSPDPLNSVTIDMLKVRQRKRNIVDSFRGGNENRVKAAGVDVLMGTARFIDGKTLSVKMEDGSEKLVEGEKIFINVGERPAPPRLEGLETIDPKIVLDSTSIQELDVVPEHLVVIGGGYVGVEFAQLFARLGAKVTILQRGEQLLSREDPEVAECLRKILEEDGVKVRLESTALTISTSPSGFGLEIYITGKSALHIQGSHILFAAGRIPNSDTLSLSAAGIKINERGYITTDEYLATSAPNIYALGDVKGPPAFTHISYDDFRIIQKNLITTPSSSPKLSTKDRLIPYVVYTDPQLGHIGLHEAEARAKFPDKQIKTAKMPMAYVARALETDESRGLMKAVVEGESGQILGFTCLGIEGGELMAVVQMAIMGGVGYEKLQDAVWAHPSLAESLNNLWGYLE
jgi:pyruvate/2-oxoglutarate dehydrogenase complex dihydrolipoamide dehydrogenase (E3) component